MHVVFNAVLNNFDQLKSSWCKKNKIIQSLNRTLSALTEQAIFIH